MKYTLHTSTFTLILGEYVRTLFIQTACVTLRNSAPIIDRRGKSGASSALPGVFDRTNKVVEEGKSRKKDDELPVRTIERGHVLTNKRANNDGAQRYSGERKKRKDESLIRQRHQNGDEAGAADVVRQRNSPIKSIHQQSGWTKSLGGLYSSSSSAAGLTIDQQQQAKQRTLYSASM
ncbi:hypothetical protein QAD02_003533 [Eretmocerus hayati]|uniref:Uncharacterized protein n=1 Tax=Eretmocerus hayati TaxID=131215 RepID=A0ACC2NPN1_9HYME|nr:hypothetical protein QAD02_003533 [Eretmocerus hayati]